MMPNLIYCCQLWNGGEEIHLQKIERALENYWRLGQTGRPPEHITPVRVLFILFDLNYAKKMQDGLNPLNFDEIFKIPANARENIQGRLPVPYFRLEISRSKFSNRTRAYLNLLPKEIKDLNYSCFRREAKKYVLDNSAWFLNLGNKNGAGAKDLPPIVPYAPKKKEKIVKNPANFSQPSQQTPGVNHIGLSPKKNKLNKKRR